MSNVVVGNEGAGIETGQKQEEIRHSGGVFRTSFQLWLPLLSCLTKFFS